MKPKTLSLCLAALLFAVPLVADDAALPAAAPGLAAAEAAEEAAPPAPARTLSAEDLAWLLAGGVSTPQRMPAGAPPCPTVMVPCKSSISGQSCTLGTCESISLGPCCERPDGSQFCCVFGNVTMRQCPCSGNGCPSELVTWRCQ